MLKLKIEDAFTDIVNRCGQTSLIYIFGEKNDRGKIENLVL